ncbi:class I SAM-dependent methyltransferase [Phenylobacterium sp.]|uniref:class I SAM-dependent methyltransferase n=1 Tax=Phenylobacterium sp. TaxID=1871053 RepID=UPI003BAC2967
MLHDFLNRRLSTGRLQVTYGDGRVETYGDGTGPEIAVRLTRRGERRLLVNPGRGLGEAYMDGDLVVTRGSFWDLLDTVGRNRGETPPSASLLARILRSVRLRLDQHNDRAAARRHVHHHYDLSLELYQRFLDADLQYSCAYFARPDMTLEEAQAAKKAHLAAKLDLRAGHKVLDIGCGWGGLALELAARHPVEVTGVTLSQEQLATAHARARAAGLERVARFDLRDYRDVSGPFDRIVSVGMLEHVGAPHLGDYFAQVARLLSDDGVAVIHAIGSHNSPGLTQPFIRKYIFPGGHIPSLSEVTAAVERTGLWIADVEIWRLHYAETLRHWRLRFEAQRQAIAALYDERFCRMWEVYLGYSELAFRHLNCMVFQLQLIKRVDALPITRDYIHEAEKMQPPARLRA